MQKAVVITSVFPPTEAVKQFALLADWELIVVGDQKTPFDWSWPKVHYLSPEFQKRSEFRITPILPWNHYARKMIGYLYAIKLGAEILVDTDDDNIPKGDWDFPDFFGGYDVTPPGRAFINVYKYFSDQHLWPRGFPLNRIQDRTTIIQDSDLTKQDVRVGVWQGLADGDPDLDAICRLTIGTDYRFKEKEPLVLNRETVAPFNSQNTAFLKDLFSLMYLPAYVNFRFTDILRGLVAQPIMWQAGYRLGFTQATVIQKRNIHNDLEDFESEIPGYLYAEKVTQIAKEAIDIHGSITDNLSAVYQSLNKHHIINKMELDLLSAWIADIQI
jgi:hypothetical protein